MIPMLISAAGRANTAVSATTQTTRTGTRATAGVCTSNAASVTSNFPGATSFSYAWERVSGSTAMAINSQTSSNTTFSGNVGAGTPEINTVFRCLVTDNFGRTAYTNNCSVTLQFTP